MNETYDGPVPSPWDDDADLAPVAPVAPDAPVQGEGSVETGAVLDDVREWFGRYITVLNEPDLDLLTLWAAHTHLAFECYTSPRLIIDSPVHGSGKTTVLEHLERLARRSVQMASLSSPALLTRMLDAEQRTVLIDEADRSLDPKKDGIAERVAVLNSGYKRGGTRPVLVPGKEGTWNVKEMPTFAPCAMAGNSPNLPEDMRSRSVRVLLMPDVHGLADETDWEVMEDSALYLGGRLAAWAETVRDQVRANRPDLPEGVRGRMAEKWRPLKRVAVAAGSDWPTIVDDMARRDMQQLEQDIEDGVAVQSPHVALLNHLYETWPHGLEFVPTADLVRNLILEHPDMWGEGSNYGKALTVQRFGRMLNKSYGVSGARLDRTGPRGYTRASLVRAWERLGVTAAPDTSTPLIELAHPAHPAHPAHERKSA